MLTLITVGARKLGWLTLSFLVVLALLVIATGLPEKLRKAQQAATNLRELHEVLSSNAGPFEAVARSEENRAMTQLRHLRTAGVAESVPSGSPDRTGSRSPDGSVLTRSACRLFDRLGP